MKIDSSTIGMESARSYHASNTSVRRFSIMDYREGSLLNQGGLNGSVADGQNDQTLNEENKNSADQAGARLYTLEDWQNGLKLSSGRVNMRAMNSGSIFEDFRQSTIRYIFNLLFELRRGRFGSPLDGQEEMSAGNDANAGTVAQDLNQNATRSMQNGFFLNTNIRVLNYTQETFRFEQEDTSFSTVGTVRTADGREINFNVDVGMSRRFQQTFREDLQLASFSMCDPLVINLDTDVAELSDQKFYFDIDADGEEDEISRLGAGSGYLALDKNGDGVINDGSELFGTASGDGFADLAKYDEDGNGWIDENDAIWSKLKIWCKDENGKDILYRLADKGVGAICLQKAATDFTMQGVQGQVNGAIRSTGVFLYENGNVGTVQHVDVAKYEQGA